MDLRTIHATDAWSNSAMIRAKTYMKYGFDISSNLPYISHTRTL
jgi:hypothetical protein